MTKKLTEEEFKTELINVLQDIKEELYNIRKTIDRSNNIAFPGRY